VYKNWFKIPNRLGKNFRKPQGNFLTHTVGVSVCHMSSITQDWIVVEASYFTRRLATPYNKKQFCRSSLTDNVERQIFNTILIPC